MNDFDRRQALLAAQRWQQRKQRRTENERELATGGVEAVETAARIGKRLQRSSGRRRTSGRRASPRWPRLPRLAPWRSPPSGGSA